MLKSRLEPTPERMQFVRVASTQLLVVPDAPSNPFVSMYVRQGLNTAVDAKKRRVNTKHQRCPRGYNPRATEYTDKITLKILRKERAAMV